MKIAAGPFEGSKSPHFSFDVSPDNEINMAFEFNKQYEERNSREISRLLKLINSYAGFKTTDALERKISKVFRNTTSDELSAWIYSVEKSSNYDELIALVEDLTNHETFFFRDSSQLDLITEKVLHDFFSSWSKDRAYKFRIWSAACASGEEAYTLAILFMDYALMKGYASRDMNGGIRLAEGLELEVIGSDISRQAVRKASEGLYMKGGLASFRNMPEKYWKYFCSQETGKDKKYFGQKVEYFTPVEAVKTKVKFFHHNLMDDYKHRFGKFDLVLCRNMLIYIEADKQKIIQDNMSKSMLRNGTLIMSAVDKQLHGELFKEYWHKNTMAFRKK